ncbi:MAG: PEGA domain-containing protein [Deltaproteobacteria bacterium]|nr:PEGA domain-containing protein [Deltaproteobacteria bacterium]
MRIIAILLVLCAVATADDKREAERYFRAGEKAYQSQNFEAAARNFEEAYKDAPLPEIAFSAAQAYRRQYRVDARPEYCARAVELYKLYLGKVKTGGRVADAADALVEMQHELDRLIKLGLKVSPEIAAEHTLLGVSPALGGVRQPHEMREVDEARGGAPDIVVTFDGKRVEPYSLNQIEPGVHAIHVEAPGYKPYDLQQNVVQGTTNMIDVALEPKPAHVTFDVEADATITLDGRPLGTTPLVTDVPAGSHVVTFSHRGREPVVRDIAFDKGQELRLHQPLAMTARRRAVPYVVIGAGSLALLSGASAIAALVEDSRASSLHNQIAGGNALMSVGLAYQDKLMWRDRFVTATWTTGALALATAGVAAWLYYADHPSPEAAHIAPMAGPSGAGAMLFGSF